MAAAIICEGKGHWVTDDGLYEILRVDDYETECDEPHPVRMRADSLDRFSPWYADSILRRATRTTRRTKEGLVDYLSYLCDGNEIHFYSRWTVGIVGTSDYAPDTGPDGFDTLTDAKRFVAGMYP